MFESIGPVWDGNEVWLVVAAGATFAAFPAWYATMFSGFYLAFLLILFFLIIRVVSFEWREKGDGEGWRRVWMWANAIGSAGIALIWGIGLANLIHGLPIDSNGDYDGGLGRPLHALHRVRGADVRASSSRSTAPATSRSARPATSTSASGVAARRLARPAAVVGRGVPRLDRRRRRRSERQGRLPGRDPSGRRDRGARAGGGARLCRQERPRVLDDGSWHRRAVATLFTGLYPRVMVSSTDFANSLDVPRGRVRALHAGRDDRRGADHAAGRPALSGLVVLRLPRAGHGRGRRGAGGRRVALERVARGLTCASSTSDSCAAPGRSAACSSWTRPSGSRRPRSSCSRRS